MLFRVACQNTARDTRCVLAQGARSKGEPRAFRHKRPRTLDVRLCAYVCVSPLLYIDLYPCVSQCQGERRGRGRHGPRGRATELQAGSPGRSPQCHPRRSRAVASRDVTRRCSDATSRQGQPTVMVAWQPLFALLPSLPLGCRTPPTLIPPHIATLSISRTRAVAQ